MVADKVIKIVIFFSVIFLLFGLEAVLVNLVVEGLARNMILFIQGILFIILAILFFLNRKPKIDMG